MEMAVESMEIAPEAIPCPARVPEYRLPSPKLVFDGGSAAELYVGKHRLI
jgi:hypothetical protein